MPREKSWKRSLLTIVLLLLLVGVTACAGAAPATTDSGDSSTAAGDATTATGNDNLPADAAEEQVLRYVSRGFSLLNPATESGFGRAFTSHIWMPFFIRDAENNIHPWLATGWDVSDDGLEYSIHIEPGAVWSDGSPVTAADAKAYFEFAMSPDCVGCRVSGHSALQLIEGAPAVVSGDATEITGLEAVDEKTLLIRLTAPKPLLLDTLAHYSTGIAKAEDMQKGENWSADGSGRVNGPFMIETWDPDTKEFELVQNPAWWGEKQPIIERITVSEAADENISFIMWQNDEVDAVQWLTNIREPLRANEPDNFYLIPYATNFFYAAWTELEPMDDLNVRRALVHAVDWEAAINAAWEGFRNERVMTGHLTPELQCYKEGNWPDFGFNPELAKEELAASKYGSAENLPLIRITTNGESPNYIRTAEIMAEQWKTNLGITNVEIRSGSIDAWGQEAEEVQLRRLSAGAVIPQDAEFIISLYDRYSSDQYSAIDDPELDALIQELRTISPEADNYCAAVQEAEAKMLGNYHIFPMIWDLYEYNVKSWVKNFSTNVDNNWTGLLDMYIAED